MPDALVLSLGHNSSAILIRDNSVLAGYETERLTGVKSDSSFPLLPIAELNNRFSIRKPCDVFVSHWELFGDVGKMRPKHWDPKAVSEISGGGHLFQTNEFFTHHDAHAWSAVTFAGRDFPQSPRDSSYVFVMDGFGTFGEHMSFYRLVDGIPILLERKYGFRHSLGLLYQYTTAFLGLKQNQDEYKLLAFEAHVDDYEGKIQRIEEMSESWINFYAGGLSAYMEPDKTDPMLDVGALPNVAQAVADMLSGICSALSLDDERAKRVVCSYVIQRIVEETVTMFVTKYMPKNIVLVGGLFYNVKINNMVSKMVPGKTCIMPLAGDQGAGLGVYSAIHPDFKWPDHVFWGPRSLDKLNQSELEESGILYFDDEDKAFDVIKDELEDSGMVNLVRGNMEYGPRALCNTTTLAIPTVEMVELINHLNDRTNEMPMAPVMTSDQADLYLEDCDKIHKSLEYMICTRDYRPHTVESMRGAAHRYPKQQRYSGRPQITKDPHMVNVLDEFGPLINTSYNFHGVPIVCTPDQIRNTHMAERSRSNDDGIPTTVVIGGK